MHNHEYSEDEATNTYESIKGTPPRDAPGSGPNAVREGKWGATAAAQRYVAQNGGELRYVKKHKQWYGWNGRSNAPDTTQEPLRRGQDLIRDLYHQAADDPHAKEAVAAVTKLDRPNVIDGIVRLASACAPIAATPKDFDRDPYLATVANGTLDLRLEASPDGLRARLREHRQSDMLTRELGKGGGLVYDPLARCPNWQMFVRRVVARTDGTPDDDLIGYLQRWCGYCLTGETSAQALLLCVGSGANGKSVFCQTTAAVLGDYAGSVSIDTLMHRAVEGNAATADLARLDGVRFVAVGENDEGRQLNEARIKAMTGGDLITARHMRGEWFDYQPQFKLLLHSNHKPRITGQDLGIWRRVKVIPFNTTIPADERDEHFFARRLAPELPGILAWMVQGCLAWQRDGLGEPASVTAATAEYKGDEDLVRQFVSEKLERVTGARVLQAEAHARFVQWAREHSFPSKLSSRGFGERVADVLGCERQKTTDGQAFCDVNWILRVED